MMLITLVIAMILIVVVAYQILQTNKKQHKIQSSLNELINDIKNIKQDINKINESVYGSKSEHDDRLWGGYEGVLGTKGKTEFLDQKLDSLIEILNKKFMDLGKKLDDHGMIFGESLYWEVMNDKLLKDPKESTSSSKSSST